MAGMKRDEACAKIAALYRKSGECTVLGQGVTAQAVAGYLREHAGVENFNFIAEDYYVERPEEGLSHYLEACRGMDEPFLVFGFSDQDRAGELARRVLDGAGVRSFFLAFPLSFTLTGRFLDAEFARVHREELGLTREMLEDESSRRLFDAYVAASVSGDTSELDRLRTGETYFKEGFMPQGPVQFIDAGAYDGDTLQEAFKRLDIKEYYALEPDPKNAAELRRTVESGGYRGVTVLQAGAYSSCGTMSFSGGDGINSRLANSGGQSVEVIDLDSLKARLGERGELFIKMDIEGAEREALAGSLGLIRSRRPYFALCVYHLIDDLIVIPRFLKENVAGSYRYALGSSLSNFRDLVLYAAPQ